MASTIAGSMYDIINMFSTIAVFNEWQHKHGQYNSSV
jgi:hypothetical protein